MIWDQFWPQLAATLIGLCLGIPITLFATFLAVGLGIPAGLYLEGVIEKRTEKETKNKVLILIKKELEQNIDWFDKWKDDPGEVGTLFLLSFVRDDSWKAISDGGDLQMIKDPRLIGIFSNAYAGVHGVMRISELHTHIVISQYKDIDKLHTYYMENLHYSVDFARDFTKEALQVIYKTLDDKDYSEELEFLNKDYSEKSEIYIKRVIEGAASMNLGGAKLDKE